jgi:enoyl-CoA hydratase
VSDVATDAVHLDVDAGGIATVTFDRPDVLNALDFAAMERFAAIVAGLNDQLADHASPVRAVILTGAGRAAFSSGGDVRALAEHRGAADGARLGRIMGDALLALERLPVPVIAAVNGYALGGGSEIALACDLRVVAEDVKLGLVHATLALIPGWGAGQRLLRLVGYGRALDMLLAARPYSAAELQALGVVHHVAPPGEALPAARALAARIVAHDAATVRAIKGLLRDGCTLPYDEALAAERARFPELWASEAHWLAVDRFLARKREG